jgi:quercetin dioxygenase-like cupin family protein
MMVLPVGPASRPDRAASAVLHDHADARVVGFHLQPGQEVAEHRSDSTVVVHVTAGAGFFRGAASESWLETGQLAVFEPGEPHAMRAGEQPLRFVAVIAPRPGG